jgi:hypothetical protein
MTPLTNAGDLAGLILLATAIVTAGALTAGRALARRPTTRTDADHDTAVSQGGQARCSEAMIRASGR